MDVRVIVFRRRPEDLYLAGRTVRSLRDAGLDTDFPDGIPSHELAAQLPPLVGPVLLVRAGVWLERAGELRWPAPSGTGRPLCALGALSTASPGCRDIQAESDHWRFLLETTGGDFNRHPNAWDQLPMPPIVFLDSRSAQAFSSILMEEQRLDAAWRRAIQSSNWRVVHYPRLDVQSDSRLRVIQLITSLQQGGAEQVVVNLAEELPFINVRSLVITLGNPTRRPLPAPPDTIDLSKFGLDRERCVAEIDRLSLALGADLLHGHLIDADLVTRLSAAGWPLLLTVHNMEPGWPARLSTLTANGAALLAACSQAVERDLQKFRLPVPTRTAWNGINFTRFRRTPEVLEAARKWRKRLGCTARDFVLIALANPRPQKRLHLLPGVVAATRQEFDKQGIGTAVHLIIVGEISRGNAAAERIQVEVRGEAERLGVSTRIRWVSSVTEVPNLLAAADALVSASAYEGLSLAQLEALAMDLPVVTTNVGGAREIAEGNPAMFVLPADAGPEQFAVALARLAKQWSSPDFELAVAPRPRHTAVRQHRRHQGQTAPGTFASGRSAVEQLFNHRVMARRYHWLYPRAIAASRPRRANGLLLITNNFSVGGAQSSARRLLLGLAAQGVSVGAAVVQEQPEHPTPGRQALASSGIPVIATPSIDFHDAAEVVSELLAALDAAPPEVVLFWNLAPICKILLADALLRTRIFDVSPGEMFFNSLARHFAKPIAWLPYRTPRDYGARLAGVVVKYEAERQRAADVLGASVQVIPNGISIPPRAERPSRAGNGLIVIGTSARLSPQKRLEDLFEALRLVHHRLPPYVVRIAGGVERGSEAYAGQLRQRAEGLPVQWIGEVEDEEMPAFLNGLDVFAMISEPAGCPNASLEAMAAGLPVIATDVGGAVEQIVDNVTGRLVPPRDPTAFAEALVELAGDSAKRQRLGAAGFDRASERFSIERMVADYRRLCWSGFARQTTCPCLAG